MDAIRARVVCAPKPGQEGRAVEIAHKMTAACNTDPGVTDYRWYREPDTGQEPEGFVIGYKPHEYRNRAGRCGGHSGVATSRKIARSRSRPAPKNATSEHDYWRTRRQCRCINSPKVT